MLWCPSISTKFRFTAFYHNSANYTFTIIFVKVSETCFIVFHLFIHLASSLFNGVVLQQYIQYPVLSSSVTKLETCPHLGHLNCGIFILSYFLFMHHFSHASAFMRVFLLTLAGSAVSRLCK